MKSKKTHPIVTNLVDKISQRRHKEGQDLEALKSLVLKEIDENKVYSVVLEGRTVAKPTHLSDALFTIDGLSNAEKKAVIVHVPTKTAGVGFMLAAYEFFLSKNMLGARDIHGLLNLQNHGGDPVFQIMPAAPAEYIDMPAVDMPAFANDAPDPDANPDLG